MPLDATDSSARVKHLASKDELHRLGEIAGRLGPGKGTRRFDPAEHHVPREAKIGMVVAGVVLALCLAAFCVRIFTRSQDGAGSAVPAATRGN